MDKQNYFNVFYEYKDLTNKLISKEQQLSEISYEFSNYNLICIDGIEKIDFNNQARNHLSKLSKIRLNQESWTLISASENAVNESIFNTWKDLISGSKLVKLS